MARLALVGLAVAVAVAALAHVAAGQPNTKSGGWKDGSGAQQGGDPAPGGLGQPGKPGKPMYPTGEKQQGPGRWGWRKPGGTNESYPANKSKIGVELFFKPHAGMELGHYLGMWKKELIRFQFQKTFRRLFDNSLNIDRMTIHLTKPEFKIEFMLSTPSPQRHKPGYPPPTPPKAMEVVDVLVILHKAVEEQSLHFMTCHGQLNERSSCVQFNAIRSWALDRRFQEWSSTTTSSTSSLGTTPTTTPAATHKSSTESSTESSMESSTESSTLRSHTASVSVTTTRSPSASASPSAPLVTIATRQSTRAHTDTRARTRIQPTPQPSETRGRTPVETSTATPSSQTPLAVLPSSASTDAPAHTRAAYTHSSDTNKASESHAHAHTATSTAPGPTSATGGVEGTDSSSANANANANVNANANANKDLEEVQRGQGASGGTGDNDDSAAMNFAITFVGCALAISILVVAVAGVATKVSRKRNAAGQAMVASGVYSLDGDGGDAVPDTQEMLTDKERDDFAPITMLLDGLEQNKRPRTSSTSPADDAGHDARMVTSVSGPQRTPQFNLDHQLASVTSSTPHGFDSPIVAHSSGNPLLAHSPQHSESVYSSDGTNVECVDHDAQAHDTLQQDIEYLSASSQASSPVALNTSDYELELDLTFSSLMGGDHGNGGQGEYLVVGAGTQEDTDKHLAGLGSQHLHHLQHTPTMPPTSAATHSPTHQGVVPSRPVAAKEEEPGVVTTLLSFVATKLPSLHEATGAMGEGDSEVEDTDLNLQVGDDSLVVAALFLAVKVSNMRVMQMLVSNGARIGSKNTKDHTLLHTCVINFDPLRFEQCMQVLQYLLANGVQPNDKDAEGGTALMYACRNGQEQVVRALLNAGASPACVDTTNMTVYMFAAAYDNAGVLAALLEVNGMYVNSRDNNGRTALHWATLTGSVECFRLLAMAELTDVCVIDSQGETILHYLARTQNFHLLVDALAECVSRDTLIRLSACKSADGDSANEVANQCDNETFFKHFAAAMAKAERLKTMPCKKRTPATIRQPPLVDCKDNIKASVDQATAKQAMQTTRTGRTSTGSGLARNVKMLQKTRALQAQDTETSGTDVSSSNDSGIDEVKNAAEKLAAKTVSRRRKSSGNGDGAPKPKSTRRDYMRVRRAESRRMRLELEENVKELCDANAELTKMLSQLQSEAAQIRNALNIQGHEGVISARGCV